MMVHEQQTSLDMRNDNRNTAAKQIPLTPGFIIILQTCRKYKKKKNMYSLQI